jgi:hypothetical protein
MSTFKRSVYCCLCFALVGLYGCGSKPPGVSSKAGEGPVLAPPKQQEDGKSAVNEAKQLPESGAQAAKVKANFASLSASDRALAEKQKICPVSGEPLGEMGPPKKVSIAGQEVFICCGSCEEPLTKEPDKYLAKVGLQPAK